MRERKRERERDARPRDEERERGCFQKEKNRKKIVRGELMESKSLARSHVLNTVFDQVHALQFDSHWKPPVQ